MRLEFEGKLELDDFVGSELYNLGPTINGRDVIKEIDETFRGKGVTVLFGIDPVAEGDVYASKGWGGTDVTPGDPPELYVGNIDLLAKLYGYDGRTVALIITNEI